MRNLIKAVFLSLVIAAPAVAQTNEGSRTTASELTALMTAYDARGWEGVGRLNIGRGGMCTGALIAPRLVLTAAHCLYDQYTGRQIDPQTVTFLAGWRNGSASAYRNVRRAAVHPKYEYSGPSAGNNVANDLAVLELESDIRLPHVQPFKTAKRPAKGASVGVVSYAQDRQNTLSLQEICHVLARQKGALVLSCDVDFGSSGAPIFAEINGEPRIVSVVSAKAMVGGRKVSLGTNLEKPLNDLLAMIASGDGVISPSAGEPRRLSVGSVGGRNAGSGGGAKFVKP